MNGNWSFGTCSDIFPFSSLQTLIQNPDSSSKKLKTNYVIETFKSVQAIANHDTIRIICYQHVNEASSVDENSILVATSGGEYQTMRNMNGYKHRDYKLKKIQYDSDKNQNVVLSILESDNKFEHLTFYSYGPNPEHRSVEHFQLSRSCNEIKIVTEYFVRETKKFQTIRYLQRILPIDRNLHNPLVVHVNDNVKVMNTSSHNSAGNRESFCKGIQRPLFQLKPNYFETNCSLTDKPYLTLVNPNIKTNSSDTLNQTSINITGQTITTTTTIKQTAIISPTFNHVNRMQYIDLSNLSFYIIGTCLISDIIQNKPINFQQQNSSNDYIKFNGFIKPVDIKTCVENFIQSYQNNNCDLTTRVFITLIKYDNLHWYTCHRYNQFYLFHTYLIHQFTCLYPNNTYSPTATTSATASSLSLPSLDSFTNYMSWPNMGVDASFNVYSKPTSMSPVSGISPTSKTNSILKSHVTSSTGINTPSSAVNNNKSKSNWNLLEINNKLLLSINHLSQLFPPKRYFNLIGSSDLNFYIVRKHQLQAYFDHFIQLLLIFQNYQNESFHDASNGSNSSPSPYKHNVWTCISEVFLWLFEIPQNLQYQKNLNIQKLITTQKIAWNQHVKVDTTLIITLPLFVGISMSQPHLDGFPLHIQKQIFQLLEREKYEILQKSSSHKKIEKMDTSVSHVSNKELTQRNTIGTSDRSSMMLPRFNRSKKYLIIYIIEIIYGQVKWVICHRYNDFHLFYLAIKIELKLIIKKYNQYPGTSIYLKYKQHGSHPSSIPKQQYIDYLKKFPEFPKKSTLSNLMKSKTQIYNYQKLKFQEILQYIVEHKSFYSRSIASIVYSFLEIEYHLKFPDLHTKSFNEMISESSAIKTNNVLCFSSMSIKNGNKTKNDKVNHFVEFMKSFAASKPSSSKKVSDVSLPTTTSITTVSGLVGSSVTQSSPHKKLSDKDKESLRIIHFNNPDDTKTRLRHMLLLDDDDDEENNSDNKSLLNSDYGDDDYEDSSDNCSDISGQSDISDTSSMYSGYSKTLQNVLPDSVSAVMGALDLASENSTDKSKINTSTKQKSTKINRFLKLFKSNQDNNITIPEPMRAPATLANGSSTKTIANRLSFTQRFSSPDIISEEVNANSSSTTSSSPINAKKNPSFFNHLRINIPVSRSSTNNKTLDMATPPKKSDPTTPINALKRVSSRDILAAKINEILLPEKMPDKSSKIVSQLIAIPNPYRAPTPPIPIEQESDSKKTK